MRSKRRNTNIRILQSQIQNIALDEDKSPTILHGSATRSASLSFPIKDKSIGSGIISKELPIIEKIPKKKGIKKDELINTKRLLTM